MNNQRRAQLRKSTELLSQATAIISSVLNEEQASYDSLPENLQESQRGEAMSDAIDYIEEALAAISEAEDNLTLAQN